MNNAPLSQRSRTLWRNSVARVMGTLLTEGLAPIKLGDYPRNLWTYDGSRRRDPTSLGPLSRLAPLRADVPLAGVGRPPRLPPGL
jgi:hypothetical protein